MMGGTQEDEGGGREEKLTGRARGMESWPGSRFIGQAAAGWDDAMTVRTSSNYWTWAQESGDPTCQ
jgi:hypothetical protein